MQDNQRVSVPTIAAAPGVLVRVVDRDVVVTVIPGLRSRGTPFEILTVINADPLAASMLDLCRREVRRLHRRIKLRQR